MIATFMTLIMMGRVSALVALIVVPVIYGAIAGFGLGLGPMMLTGIRDLAPTGVMLMFAIVFFSLVSDAGMFDPLIRRILDFTKGDPLRVMIGTVGIGLLTALDGDGAVTYVICVSARVPVYKRVGLKLQYMATLLVMCVGSMHLVPWGGPTARAAAAMKVDVGAVFQPLIPVMIVGFIYILMASIVMGLKERRRLGMLNRANEIEPVPEIATRSQLLLWVNWTITCLLLVGMFTAALPLASLFMIATALALLVNYRTVREQREQLAVHAPTVVAVLALVFAAGIFTGILSGSGMLDAMAKSIVAVMPISAGPYLAPATTLLSGPATYLIPNDAFYFGLLPVLAKAGSLYGITPVEMARASLVGQPLHMISPLVASTYLLVSLLDLNYGDNQRRSILWVIGLVLAMLVAAIVFHIIPWRA